MIEYCSRCDINWSRLWAQDIGDETYEFCPLCKSSAYLEPGRDIVGYILVPVTYKIINPETGLELVRPPRFAPSNPKTYQRRVYDETIEAFRDRREQVQGDYIDKYLELCQRMDPESASLAMEPWPEPKRKYHMQTTY